VNGVCNNGLCECVDGYFGPTCSDGSHPIDGFNVTGHKITATVESQVFSFLVLSIVEQDPDMEIANFVNLTTLDFVIEIENTSMSQFWNFSTSQVLNTSATVQVYITFFNVSTNITFGDETFYMAPNTFKLAVYVSNWPFKSAANTMRVWFENSAGNGALSSCNVNSNANSGDNLRWLTLNIGGVTSYSQMVQFAMLDGTKRYITYETSNTSAYAAVIPFFWYDVIIDPNFGFLAEAADSQCDTLSDTLRHTWEVYLAIPIGVAFIVLAVVIWKYFRIRDLMKQGTVHSVDIDMDEE